MSIVQATGLRKEYPGVLALDDLTCEIPEGAVGLLGPNGAGKSTFIKILLGFTKPTRGSVRILGSDPAQAPIEIRQKVGYMPEVESFIPGMTAVDYVYLAGRLTGLPHTDSMQRTHRVLNFVGLSEERYRKVETYSTGMKQKVKFAQAIVHHPTLLLLDEPTTGLDPRAREEMLQLIRDVSHGKGMHVVLSTHILHDVEVVCDHVIILHRGRRVRQDDLSKLTEGLGQPYEVHVKGDRAKFLDGLRGLGLTATEAEGGAIHVAIDNGTDPILRAAVDAGVQVRKLGRLRSTLDGLFDKLIREA